MNHASLAQRLAELAPEERQELMGQYPPEVRDALQWNWRLWARPEQLPPKGDWRMWLILAGRGFGKTRTGAEWVQASHKKYSRMHMVGRTAADIRDVMVDGPSGILRIAPPNDRPIYQPSKKRVTWPNGAYAVLFSSDEPESLRGPQCEAFWADELCAWKYVQETWDQLMMGFRLGATPRGVITTTPKPIKLIKRLLSDPTVVVTRGRTYDNIVNLAPTFIEQIIKPYEGTRLGRQELDGEVIEDYAGALWSATRIHDLRVDEAPQLQRIVVAIDPQTAEDAEDAETGIAIAGKGTDGHAYVLADYSIKGSPDTWARRSIVGYNAFKADRVVAEVNQGGDMVEHTLRTVDPAIPYRKVHASRGKLTRAEPIAALYEQGKVHHVGTFPKLEEEMCTWVPGMKSPNRMDALVWALTDLMLDGITVTGGTWNTRYGRRRSPWRV